MKIFKKGRTKNSEVKIVCSHCDSVLIIQANDIKISSSQRDGTDYMVVCMNCGKNFDLGHNPFTNPTTYYEETSG